MASSPPSTRTVIENMSVVDGGALDCSACYSPLKPPVFQVNKARKSRRVHNVNVPSPNHIAGVFTAV